MIIINTDANNKINYFKRIYSTSNWNHKIFKIINRTNRTVRLVNVRCDFSKNLR